MKLLTLLFFICTSYLAIAQQQLSVFDIARTGTTAQAEMVIKENPDAFYQTSHEGFSPLILACYRGNDAVAKWLIDRHSNVDGTSKMGTPLMATVVKGNFMIAKLLLDHGANPNLADANGTTALIYAVQFKNAPIIQLLLEFNADKALTDIHGKTAFEYAAFAGDEAIINLLK